jgi:hypothetical protein
MTDTLNLSRLDVINLAMAVSAAATSSYCDERLTTASVQHHLAARLWFEAGYDRKADTHRHTAQAIAQEVADLAAGETEAV